MTQNLGHKSENKSLFGLTLKHARARYKSYSTRGTSGALGVAVFAGMALTWGGAVLGGTLALGLGWPAVGIAAASVALGVAATRVSENLVAGGAVAMAVAGAGVGFLGPAGLAGAVLSFKFLTCAFGGAVAGVVSTLPVLDGVTQLKALLTGYRDAKSDLFGDGSHAMRDVGDFSAIRKYPKHNFHRPLTAEASLSDKGPARNFHASAACDNAPPSSSPAPSSRPGSSRKM